MTNIFKRINDIISANINDLIDRVEDPGRMIKQIIREMEENIHQAKEGVIEAIASEKRLQKELEANRVQSEDWLKKAEDAFARKMRSSPEQPWCVKRSTTPSLKP